MKNITLLVLALSLSLTLMLAPLASSSPDGLEKVAERFGFVKLGISLNTGLWPDYILPGIADKGLAVGFAGFLGILIVFSFNYLLGKLLLSKNRRTTYESDKIEP